MKFRRLPRAGIAGIITAVFVGCLGSALGLVELPLLSLLLAARCGLEFEVVGT